MIFKWLKKLLGLYDSSPSSEVSNGGSKPSTSNSFYDELDKRRENIKLNRNKLKQTPIDWYFLSTPLRKDELQIRLFLPRKFQDIPSLQSLKRERLRKEARALKVQEEKVKSLLCKLEIFIRQRKFQESKQMMNEITHEILSTKDPAIRKHYIVLQKSFSELYKELENEKHIKFVEEQKRKEKEERLRQEIEKKERIEYEKRIEEEQRRKKQEVNRLVEEANRREQAELAEKKRLDALSVKRKDNWSDFKQILDNNGIQYLYHFTDKRNIPSIKRHGGLFSWQYCDTHGIKIPSPGGIGFGRNLDQRYGLEDYVRLSFCKEHPMKYIAMKDGRIQNPVVLLIDVEVIYLNETLFSDMNATKTGHNTGGTIDDLNKVRFDIVKLPNHFNLEEPEKSFYQAEVMVKTFVPLKYIINLNCF